MPARRKKRKENKNIKIKRYLYLVVFFVLLISAFAWIKGAKIWDGKEILITAYPSQESTSILILNPKKEELYKIDIPDNTQVNVVGNRGEWRLGSLWKLGFDQKLGGEILAKSIVKNFYIPVYTWGGNAFDSYYKGNIFQIVKLSLLPGKTNLGLIERVKLARLSISIKDVNKYHISLTDTELIKKERLRDGNMGFVITSNYPNKLLPLLNIFPIDKVINLSIVNVAGVEYRIDPLASAIETMGAKVISTKTGQYKQYSPDTDCVVEGSRIYSKNIAKVFSCTLSQEKNVGGSDLVMIIGEKFIDRF